MEENPLGRTKVGQRDGSTFSWLRWKVETTLGGKDSLEFKTTLSLCRNRKGSLQDKAANLDIALAEVKTKKYAIL